MRVCPTHHGNDVVYVGALSMHGHERDRERIGDPGWRDRDTRGCESHSLRTGTIYGWSEEDGFEAQIYGANELKNQPLVQRIFIYRECPSLEFKDK